MLCSMETLLKECSQCSRLDAPLKHRQWASQITENLTLSSEKKKKIHVE